MNIKTDNDFINKKRFDSDSEADRLIETLFESDRAGAVYELASCPMDKLGQYISGDPDLNNFLSRQPDLPVWHEPEKMKQASEFYMEYALEIMTFLGAVSLPNCYAAWPGNKVLYLSEKMSSKQGKRLLDTAAFVIAISEPGAFDDNGVGFKAVQQVRLIHALARYHILHSGKWNMKWGLPVNQEDMAGTNLAFSYTVIKAMEKIKYRINEQDFNAYLHLWAVVGFIMKIDSHLLPHNRQDAEVLDQVIRKRNFRKSEEGQVLTRHLMDHYREALPAGLNGLVESQVKYLVGPQISDMIGLKSNLLSDLIIRIISGIQEFRNRVFPHRSTYRKMKKDHHRLKNLYT